MCAYAVRLQDGSCNGLQHYAALARDQSGAEAVNLVSSPAPADVYSTVARVMSARISKHAAEGRSEAVKFLQRNGGSVDRKLVKQTVMTSVYGVTHIGARQQIENRLVERGWTNRQEVFQVGRQASQWGSSGIMTGGCRQRQSLLWRTVIRKSMFCLICGSICGTVSFQVQLQSS